MISSPAQNFTQFSGASQTAAGDIDAAVREPWVRFWQFYAVFGCRLTPNAIVSVTSKRAPMSIEAPRQAPMMPLRELVDRYRSLAGNFGKPVALSTFGLSQAETERLFSAYDEDYHISRFFHFTQERGTKYSINGIPVTHVSLDAEIQTIL